MRAPYETYRKHQYLVKKHLASDVESMMKVCPKNCTHNCTILINEALPVQLCTLGQEKGEPLDPSKLLVCNRDEQAEDCSAYTPSVTNRDEALAILKKNLSDPKVKIKKYPDISALEWVMDNHLHHLKKNPPGVFARLVFWCIALLEGLVRGYMIAPPSKIEK